MTKFIKIKEHNMGELTINPEQIIWVKPWKNSSDETKGIEVGMLRTTFFISDKATIKLINTL